MIVIARVGLVGENSVEYVNHLLDIWNNGDCAVLIDWRIPISTALEMMKEAGVRVCYIETGKYDIPTYSCKINFITYERKSNSAKLLPAEIYDKFKENYSHDEAIILYSSGTTGKAKGIILSHYAINTNADAIIDYMNPSGKDCIYIVKVFSHSSTLTGELLVALKSNIKLVIGPTIVPPRFVFSNIEKFGVSIVCLNPTLLQKYADEYGLGKFSLTTLKTIYVSGSILNDKTYVAAHAVFKNTTIYNVYGLSETGPRVTAQRSNCCKGNSIGKPIKGVEIKIVDDDGNLVKQGERGIIHVNTPSRFDGYITGNEKNKSVYREWLNTGDVGFIDVNDELHIVDRVDDVMIIDSHKVYPSEIEGFVLQHKKILQCVVVGICGAEKTKVICFYKSINNEDIKLEIYQMLHSLLPSYEVPNVFINVNTFRQNSCGKIDKHYLLDTYWKVK